ncbi:hypothetical protein LTS17_006750 [Exophiala oligosperma]
MVLAGKTPLPPKALLTSPTPSAAKPLMVPALLLKATRTAPKMLLEVHAATVVKVSSRINISGPIIKTADGHFARDCPEPKKMMGACFNCGEDGHVCKYFRSRFNNTDRSLSPRQIAQIRASSRVNVATAVKKVAMTRI